MPQLDPITFIDQIISFTFVLLILYILTSKYILPRIYAGFIVRYKILNSLNILNYEYIIENLNNSYINFTRRLILKLKLNVEKYLQYKLLYIRYFILVYLNNYVYLLQNTLNCKIINIYAHYLRSMQKFFIYQERVNYVKSSLFIRYKGDIINALAFNKPTSAYSQRQRFNSNNLI